MMKIRMAVVLWAMAAGAVAAERFPMTAAEIGFGKTLADFGVRDAKTVFAQDFGFNPSNATAAIQKAIDSGRRRSSSTRCRRRGTSIRFRRARTSASSSRRARRC